MDRRDYETTFVGNSAASFTYTEHLPVAVWPTADEARGLLADYERARERPFTPEERRRSIDHRPDHRPREHLAERLRRVEAVAG
jgi:hypothetical protein